MENNELIYSKILILLCKGVVYKVDDLMIWRYIETHRYMFEDYFSKIGLLLVLDEVDGYCYLKQDSQENNLPSLIMKRQLSYNVSLLLVVLRKRLLDFDAKDSDSRLIVSTQELIESMSLFFKETTDEVKLKRNIESSIKSVVDLGFLKPLRNNVDRYEVQRIIRSIVEANKINELQTMLEAYKSSRKEDE